MAFRVIANGVRSWSRSIQFVRNASKEAILKSSDEITPELKAGIQRIKNLQKTFARTGHEPDVYRMLPRDVVIYRVMMAASVFAVLTSITCFYMMATGKMPKKQQ